MYSWGLHDKKIGRAIILPALVFPPALCYIELVVRMGALELPADTRGVPSVRVSPYV
jgi:hypothetical protein